MTSSLLLQAKIKRHSLYNNNTSILEYEKYINHKIYLFLLGRTSVLEELHFDKGERKHLIEHLYKSSKEFLVPYLVGLERSIDKYCKQHVLDEIFISSLLRSSFTDTQLIEYTLKIIRYDNYSFRRDYVIISRREDLFINPDIIKELKDIFTKLKKENERRKRNSMDDEIVNTSINE
ncbi:hypothetical protein BCR32DRAFT_274641 [Anaeromyces robustus]|uniref:Uncharacterized protein n=1 Tax=Anaeromyces robustus TaxID=1754192 RepID=A0A1Y1XNM6_9FUNG|nr:hypothetical protein BCR32DRAFT_274641 [Anaeromyces robustus]|eukprot:ORX87333.1 hypothetical protein BCR32DRAFT_274641 [Anaeromyces robustus]